MITKTVNAWNKCYYGRGITYSIYLKNYNNKIDLTIYITITIFYIWKQHSNKENNIHTNISVPKYLYSLQQSVYKHNIILSNLPYPSSFMIFLRECTNYANIINIKTNNTSGG